VKRLLSKAEANHGIMGGDLAPSLGDGKNVHRPNFFV